MSPIIVAGIATAVALFVLGLAIDRVLTRRRLLGVVDLDAPAAIPPSVYPRIDASACICSGACVSVCPERDVLAMIGGRPRIVQPSACIGHGDCLRSCPVNAITLVLGSVERPVDVPVTSGSFESTVPGLYVAGELGGIGLIHNAVAQGKQAVVAALDGIGAHGCEHDVVIVGSGPAGLGAALEAKRRGVRYAVFEKGAFGGAIRSYPRAKIVMTAPMDLPGIGKVKLRRTSKEALLEVFEDVARRAELRVIEHAEVTAIRRAADGFVVEAGTHVVTARRVVLAIGRRGIPRRLAVPGADQAHVIYEVTEPARHRGQPCVVIGGGDSAIEIALALAAQPATPVVLVHRGADFARAKPDNQRALAAAEAAGAVVVRRATEITRVDAGAVELRGGGGIAASVVVGCLGADVPVAWLRGLGLELRELRGEPIRASG